VGKSIYKLFHETAKVNKMFVQMAFG